MLTKIRDKIRLFFKNLVDFGVDQNLPYLELRKAKLMNVIVSSITAILLLFLIMNILISNYILAIGDIVCILLVSVPSWILQYKRKYTANLILITSAFLIFTSILTIVAYDPQRQTEHILITLAVMPIFLFEGFWKNLMFAFFPICFYIIKFIAQYNFQGYIELQPIHIIYAITFLIIYVLTSYFKKDMLHFYELLNESNKTKAKLFRIISHDIRNPFSSLLGSSDIQLRYLESGNIEKFEKTSAIINSSSKKIYDLTQTLFDWSLTQTDTFIVKKEELDLTDLIKNVVDFCSISSRPKDIELIYQPDQQIILNCDNIMTQIAVRNIITNAIKFSFRNSKIVINVFYDKNNVIISVKDDGVGISIEKQAALFDENVLNSEFGTEKERGTGLGLLISKELIENQSGTIIVSSQEGSGSEFQIILPQNVIKQY